MQKAEKFIYKIFYIGFIKTQLERSEISDRKEAKRA